MPRRFWFDLLEWHNLFKQRPFASDICVIDYVMAIICTRCPVTGVALIGGIYL